MNAITPLYVVHSHCIKMLFNRFFLPNTPKTANGHSSIWTRIKFEIEILNRKKQGKKFWINKINNCIQSIYQSKINNMFSIKIICLVSCLQILIVVRVSECANGEVSNFTVAQDRMDFQAKKQPRKRGKTKWNSNIELSLDVARMSLGFPKNFGGKNQLSEKYVGIIID